MKVFLLTLTCKAFFSTSGHVTLDRIASPSLGWSACGTKVPSILRSSTTGQPRRSAVWQSGARGTTTGHALALSYNWTPSACTQKINLPANQKGCKKSEATYEKLSARKNQICCDYFCKTYFLPLFQNTFQNNAQTKIGTADFDSPRRTLLCRGLRSY